VVSTKLSWHSDFELDSTPVLAIVAIRIEEQGAVTAREAWGDPRCKGRRSGSVPSPLSATSAPSGWGLCDL